MYDLSVWLIYGWKFMVTGIITMKFPYLMRSQLHVLLLLLHVVLMLQIHLFSLEKKLIPIDGEVVIMLCY